MISIRSVCEQSAGSVVAPKCKIYTPMPLAAAIVRALGDAREAMWLEPSHGRGAFVEALSSISVPRGRIRAIDLDSQVSPNDKLAHTIRGLDFLEWAATTDERFDRIVGNPPYTAISQLPAARRAVAARVEDFEGLPIGSCSNTWYAFVLRAIRLLRNGGSLAFILPSAVEYAEYSESLRVAIRSRFECLEVLRCRRPLFENVQEGTVVVMARGYQSGPFRFRRQEFKSPEKLIASLGAATNKLRECPQTAATKPAATIAFRTVADVRLGGVTGDSRYFLLTEEQRRLNHLPVKACTPVVSKARHLRAAIVTNRTWQNLRGANERVWLFNPTTAVRKYPKVRRYLRRSVETGGCNRKAYKIQSRRPWSRTPLPVRPHGFVSGMSKSGPWICLNEYGPLNATNTLYVVTFRDTTSVNERFGYALSLFSSPVRRQLRKSARRYADGLVKYEPSALTSLQLPKLPARDFRKAYCNAVSYLLLGRRAEAKRIADREMGLTT